MVKESTKKTAGGTISRHNKNEMGKGLCIQISLGNSDQVRHRNVKRSTTILIFRVIQRQMSRNSTLLYSPLRDFSIEISSNIKRYKENFIFHLHGLYILPFFNINYKYLFHISDSFNFNINSSRRDLSTFKRTMKQPST